MIAASILKYVFITVICCEEIAMKLFKHFLQLFIHDVPYIQVTAGRSLEVFQLQQLTSASLHPLPTICIIA